MSQDFFYSFSGFPELHRNGFILLSSSYLNVKEELKAPLSLKT